VAVAVVVRRGAGPDLVTDGQQCRQRYTHCVADDDDDASAAS